MQVRLESFKIIEINIPFALPRGSAADPAAFKTGCVLIASGGGHLGFGEAPVFLAPTYDEQFLAQTHSALELFAQAVARLGRRSKGGVEVRVEDAVLALSRFRGNTAAKAAMEMALVDLYARQSGAGARDVLTGYARQLGHPGLAGRFAGLDVDAPIAPQGTSLALNAGTGERSAELERLAGLGYRRLKVKVDSDFDQGELLALRAMAPMELSADANGSLGDTGAARRLAEAGFSYLEQPFAPGGMRDLASLHEIGASTGEVRIALDESITTPGSLRDLAAFVPFSIAVLKVSRLGGIAALMEAVMIAESAKLAFYIGGMYDTPVLRRLNALLIQALNPPEVSDLGPDSDFFDESVPPVLYRADDGLRLVHDDGVCGPFVPAKQHIGAVSEISA